MSDYEWPTFFREQNSWNRLLPTTPKSSATEPPMALAIVALEEGNGEFANQLTGMASEVLFHAEEIKRRYRPWQPDASPQYSAH